MTTETIVTINGVDTPINHWEEGGLLPYQKGMTPSDIKWRNEEAGGYFFQRKTMSFFGDTMRSFRVVNISGYAFLRRVKAPAKVPCGHTWIGKLRPIYVSGHIGLEVKTGKA